MRNMTQVRQQNQLALWNGLGDVFGALWKIRRVFIAADN